MAAVSEKPANDVKVDMCNRLLANEAMVGLANTRGPVRPKKFLQ